MDQIVSYAEENRQNKDVAIYLGFGKQKDPQIQLNPPLSSSGTIDRKRSRKKRPQNKCTLRHHDGKSQFEGGL